MTTASEEVADGPLARTPLWQNKAPSDRFLRAFEKLSGAKPSLKK